MSAGPTVGLQLQPTLVAGQPPVAGSSPLVTKPKVLLALERSTLQAPDRHMDASSVRVKFEMAPPGSPEAFKTCTEAVTRKVKGGSRPETCS